MENIFYAYLDDFDEIAIIIKKDHYHPNNKYFLKGNNEIIDLNVEEVTSLGDYEKLIVTFDAYIDLSQTYYVSDEFDFKTELFVGKIVRSPLFDQIYYYKKNDLGYVYTKEFTKFKIWSPVAKGIKLELVSPKGKTEFIDLKYKSQGVWRTVIDKDLDRYKYRYHVYINGETKIITDPYAIASNANSTYNYIVDKSKFYQMKYLKSNRPENKQNSVIYETSFRDFTSFFKENKERSTYKFFVDDILNKKGYGLKYLKDLGITHIELMPFYSFDDVDELDRFKKYNWGYNPRELNVPSGLYTMNPDDPYQRINDLKYAIDMIHKEGLCVIMDAVYNHVFNPDTFPYEVLCPGYFYNYNHEGIRTEYSGCKNDVSSMRNMVHKFIMDSLLYWLHEYRLDGFRFDLMGLIDLGTINDIAQEADYIDKNILIFGEGWKMVYSNQADSLAHMFNRNVIHSVGFFNDRERNAVKAFAKGYNDFDTLKYTLTGSCIDRYLFKYASQSINYVECHDDMTLVDSISNEEREMDIKELKARSILATSMNILSLGIPFLHQGQELFMSKDYHHNTYNVGDELNSLRWDKVKENKEYIEFIKKLLLFRKNHSVFLYNTQTEIKENTQVTRLNDSMIFFELKDEKEEIAILFKNDLDKEEFSLDGYNLELSNLKIESDQIEGIGVAIYRRNINGN